MGPNIMLPLLLMDDDQNNEDLIFMLMLNQNREPVCEPTNHHHIAHYHEPARGSHGLRAPTVPKPAVNQPEVVFTPQPVSNNQGSIKTYKIHPDGTRTEIFA